MRKDQCENLRIRDFKNVLLPLKRGRLLKRYIDVGFDTEFTSEGLSTDRELISLQFSLCRGKSAIYYINKCEGISSEELLRYTLKFLREHQTEPEKHIFLVCHFGLAELSKINDFYEEYRKIKNGVIFKTRPRVSEFNKAIRWEKDLGNFVLHVVDLYGHMKMSLEKIGIGLGFEKIKLEADRLGHEYWITRMKELSEKHRDIYEKYALRDAEIAIEAWNLLKKRYAELNLDPHLYTTFTSLAVASFRRRLQKRPCPTRLEPRLSKQRMKDGSWREHIVKKTVYDGDLNIRLLAALSYWGGNNQAFCRGYLKNIDATYWDFKSLYIIAGILQPLSNEDTVYKRIMLQDVKDGYEGFAEVDFSFPKSERYPCLPVQENYYPKLMFPLKGISYCTLAELRQALDQNVNVRILRGYGFYPSDNEINHELKPFLAEILKNKSFLESSGKRGSAEYNLEKARMVGIIGRFAYMKPSHTAEDISRLLHVSGLKSEEFRRYGRKKALRALYTRSEVGGSWIIEWASLILGKARSLASWAINRGERCLSISTDGGFWLGNPKFNETDLHRQLAEWHSGIRLEGKLDELWIGRNRLYAAWYKGEVLHTAMAGVAVPGRSRAEKKANFTRMIRESLDAGHELYHESETTRLTGLNDFLYDNIPLDSVEKKIKKISWRFDGKRKLDSEINVFKGFTFTKPYETVVQAYREYEDIKPVGRPKSLTESLRDKLKTMEYKKLAHKQAAEKLGVSTSTVRRERSKLEMEKKWIKGAQ